MEDCNSKTHAIFKSDPLKLQALVNKYVRINLKNGTDLFGIVYTVDPVSQSFVLLSKEKSLSLKIVMKHSVDSVEVLPEVAFDQSNMNINELFNMSTANKNKGFIKEKEELKSWLMSNMISVEEEGDVLKIDTVEIHPPYCSDSCYSSNPIVLDRIQSLIKDMKKVNS